MMDLMDVQDISYVDIDELGVRPVDWLDESNDFDEKVNGYLGKEKPAELNLIKHEEKFITEEEDDDALVADEDDSNYEIDPETGEKIFRGVLVASSPSFSLSNDNWIEEYLSNIGSSSSSSSANQLIPLLTNTNPELLFGNIPFSDDQPDTNWLSKYISLDQSTTTNNMFPDQFLDENERNLLQTTSPIYLPLSNKTHRDSFMNLLSVSNDDEHSISSNSNRLFSSFESDSTTHDSEFTFDRHSIETKLEKFEHNDYSIPHMMIRRSSTRSNCQGQQDDDNLRRYNIPLSLYEITQSSTEEYNRHLAHLTYLNPEQIHIIKDIRRRGKNKVAAQNCRKRKAHSVESLLEDVDELKRVKYELEERKKSYQQQIAETRHQYEYLHQQVLPNRQLPPAIIVK